MSSRTVSATVLAHGRSHALTVTCMTTTGARVAVDGDFATGDELLVIVRLPDGERLAVYATVEARNPDSTLEIQFRPERVLRRLRTFLGPLRRFPSASTRREGDDS